MLAGIELNQPITIVCGTSDFGTAPEEFVSLGQADVQFQVLHLAYEIHHLAVSATSERQVSRDELGFAVSAIASINSADLEGSYCALRIQPSP